LATVAAVIVEEMTPFVDWSSFPNESQAVSFGPGKGATAVVVVALVEVVAAVVTFAVVAFAVAVFAVVVGFFFGLLLVDVALAAVRIPSAHAHASKAARPNRRFTWLLRYSGANNVNRSLGGERAEPSGGDATQT
jgi:fatty acid desaturase